MCWDVLCVWWEEIEKGEMVNSEEVTYVKAAF